MAAAQFHPEKSGDAGAALAVQLAGDIVTGPELAEPCCLPSTSPTGTRSSSSRVWRAAGDAYGDPMEAALAWEPDGASWIDLVDLDAAFGRGSNADLLANVISRAGRQRRAIRRYQG